MKKSLLQIIEGYVSGLQNGTDTLHFHNLQHTKEVVVAAFEIGQAEKLSEDELEVLTIAAWFHDTGFRYHYQNHEEISKEIAREFLTSITYPKHTFFQKTPLFYSIWAYYS